MSEDSTRSDALFSLEGLSVDWEFEPDNPLGKRAYDRLIIKELCDIFQVKNIPVMLVTEKIRSKALLVDISQTGISIRLKQVDLMKSQLVKVGFFLGKLKLISKGRIRNIRKDESWLILGIEFIGLSEEANEFLSSIYSSTKL